ncbi:hypothetical protein PIB30_021137 [Stylosanthes scabra]|uniref:Uncharacterized protein n=1 Tax=Stylosanthes scabra TaxID=79078 RepID=A0ABU6R963_9FABA|nr:hypothetical protein [Stylosanthes scabra]
MGRSTLNRLGAVIATSILTMKFITDGGRVGVIHGDKQEAEKCHNATLHISKEQIPKLEKPKTSEKCLLVDLEPPEKKMQERPKPKAISSKSKSEKDPTNHKLSIIHGSKPVAQKLR